VQSPEQLHDLVTAFRVEGAGGLVGQHEGRVVGEGTGDGEALALAPDRTPGAAFTLSERPRRSRRSRARVSATLRLRPATIAGIATFSRTLMPSSRLKNWKTIPM
jgi:hypothetical protein